MSAPSFAILGKKRAGKSEVAKHLAGRYGHTVLGFADPLRELALRINPILDGATGETYEWAINTFGYENVKDWYPEARRFLKGVGNGVREVLGNDLWVVNLAARIVDLGDAPAAVPDVRYPNELAALVRAGFYSIRVVRPSDDQTDNHISETALDDAWTDFTIVNDGSVTDLRDRVDEILVDLAKREFAQD